MDFEEEEGQEDEPSVEFAELQVPEQTEDVNQGGGHSVMRHDVVQHTPRDKVFDGRALFPAIHIMAEPFVGESLRNVLERVRGKLQVDEEFGGLGSFLNARLVRVMEGSKPAEA